jgi:hypothetical protein
MIRLEQGSCHLPCFAATPGTVKTFSRTSLEDRYTQDQIIYRCDWLSVYVGTLDVTTSIPQDIRRGSECDVGTRTFYTVTRVLFNER